MSRISTFYAANGRRNRQSYIAISLLMLLGWLAYGGLLIVFLEHGNAQGVPGLTTGALWILGLGLIPLAIVGLGAYLSAAQRCRDFGWTGWAVLLGFVPCFGIMFMMALWFIPGNIGTNRYGRDPQNVPGGYTPRLGGRAPKDTGFDDDGV